MWKLAYDNKKYEIKKIILRQTQDDSDNRSNLMKPKTKSIIQFVVLLAFGILLVWLAYGQVADQKDKIISAFTNANYFWVFIYYFI